MEQKRLLVILGGVVAGAIALIFFISGMQGSSDGALIFQREKCIECHSFKGRGGSIGPELTGVTQRRSDSWIRAQIKNSKSHYPDSRMPSFKHLSRKEAMALIEYLKS